ncbi:trans-aconitate 2-methyltransferase [Vampirovibrio sp.]|uniref:class I SAM-dependent methyltransferase n=1 Tax=Vampirovibrio sp. TaxID=2717857 RepID=UPI003593E519
MAISIRQALQSGFLGESGQPLTVSKFGGVKLAERSLIEQTLMQLYPRLQLYDFALWKWFNGPLIPDFLAQGAPTDLRRIVVIGCGDGAFANLLALLMPNVEIIGIDTDSDKIADARATIGYRQNIKFINANAAVLTDIPCDRIIYNHCLSKLQNINAFKKLVLKTSQWLVDEGDFLIRESPLALLGQPALLKALFSRLRQTLDLGDAVTMLLREIGYSTASAYASKGILGLRSQLYLQVFKDVRLVPVPLLTSVGIAPKAASFGEWHDVSEQSDDSLLGFLFSDARSDFSRELV